MQTKLSRGAAEDKARRVGDLYNLLYDESWLKAASIHGRQTAGSKTAGGDGITMRDFEQNLEGNLKAIQASLKAERFEPHPVRRKHSREINASGRIKVRPLGIPDSCDRIVQDALRKVLEPIWEADFSRHSSGFRPNRRTKDAVVYICHQLLGKSRDKNGWVIEGDSQSFFDHAS